MLFHTKGKCFKAEVEEVCGHGCESHAKVANELNSRFGVECVLYAKCLGVYKTVIGLIGSCELGVLVTLCPVKATAVNDSTANDLRVTVHILCCGVDNDIRAVLKGTAENGRCKGVVDEERNAVRVSEVCVSLNIKNDERGVCYSLAKEKTGVLIKVGGYFLVGHIGSYKSYVYSESLESYRKEIDSSAVDRGHTDDVLTCGRDVEDRKQVCRLTGGGENTARAALKIGYFLFNRVNRGVGNAGVHMTCNLKIKKIAKVICAVIFICSALAYGENSGLSVCGRVSRLNTFSFYFIV